VYSHGFSEPKLLPLFPYTKPTIPESTEPEKVNCFLKFGLINELALDQRPQGLEITYEKN